MLPHLTILMCKSSVVVFQNLTTIGVRLRVVGLLIGILTSCFNTGYISDKNGNYTKFMSSQIGIEFLQNCPVNFGICFLTFYLNIFKDISTYPPSNILMRVGSVCFEEDSFSPCSSFPLSFGIFPFIFFPNLPVSSCMSSGCS